MRIELITFEREKFDSAEPYELTEKFGVLETEDCCKYDLNQVINSNDKNVDIELNMLELFFNNGDTFQFPFNSIVKFGVEGVEVIKNGELSDKYSLYKMAGRLMSEK